MDMPDGVRRSTRVVVLKSYRSTRYRGKSKEGGGLIHFFVFFQAEDGIRDIGVTGVQTCALPISSARAGGSWSSTSASTRRRPRGSLWQRRWRWRRVSNGGGSPNASSRSMRRCDGQGDRKSVV